MPARRIEHSPRRSRRLSYQSPKRYDEDGFEVFDDDVFRCPSEPASVNSYASSSPPPPAPSRDIAFHPTSHSHSKRKGDDHIKRPKNAFIMYRSAWCTENKDQPDAEKDHRKVSRMLGAQWKLLSKAEQEPYRRMAEAEAREHALMYPGYKYKPTSRGKRSAKWAGRKAFRDTRADQEKCDRIVRELFIIKSPAIKPKIEASASPDLVSSPIPSQPPSADDELVYPADEFVPTEDIPYLDLDASEESKACSFTTEAQTENAYHWDTTANDSHLGFPGPIEPCNLEPSFSTDFLGYSEHEPCFFHAPSPPLSLLSDAEFRMSGFDRYSDIVQCPASPASDPSGAFAQFEASYIDYDLDA